MLNSSKFQKFQKRVLYKTAAIVQHYNFLLLSKHISIINHVKISCRFSKFEDAYGPCVSVVQISI